MVTTLFIDFSDTQGKLTLNSWMVSCWKSNSFKLLWLVLLLARIKKIHQKIKALKLPQNFSHYKSIVIFRRSMTANSVVPGRILLNFEPIQNFMVVLVTCKNIYDTITNEVFTIFSL